MRIVATRLPRPAAAKLPPPARTRAPVIGNQSLQRQIVRRSPERTRNCSSGHTRMIQSHSRHARAWVGETISMLGNYLSGRVTQSDVGMVRGAYLANFDTAGARRLIGMSRPAARRYVRRNHPTWNANLAHVRSQLEQFQTGLTRPRTYVCPRIFCRSDELMSVTPAFEYLPNVTGGEPIPERVAADVTHACPEWFECTDFFDRVTTIIHEVGHADLLWSDHAYEFQPAYYRMGWNSARTNPDSYSVFSRQLYHLGRHGPRARICE